MDIPGILQSFAVTAEQNLCEILSVYASGSYANGYYSEGISDLDLLIFVDHAPGDLIEQLLKNTHSPVELDLCVLEVSALYNAPNSIQVRESVMSSKLCGQLLWGKDLLKDWTLPPVEEYTQCTVEMVFEFIHRAHGADCDMQQLTYPDPDDPYCGYLVMRNGALSTKQIISLYTWIATARLARDHQIYCGCKKVCLEQSALRLERSFTEVLQKVYENCRKNWKYTIPEQSCDQQMLRHYCRTLLKFEQTFVDEFLD